MKSEPLEIHVFGATIGESIAVRLPCGLWGVVDCYTPNLSAPETNPLVKFLKERGVESLEFLCLTHPHEDHYRGIGHLFVQYSPKRVWLFGSLAQKDLYAKVAQSLKASADSKNIDFGDTKNVDEIVSFFDLVRSEYRNSNRKPRLEICRLQLNQILFEILDNPNVRITALGPSGGLAMEYESSLTKCFALAPGQLLKQLPKIDHNMISGGLLIEYGNARVILGGDIETEAWEEAMRVIPAERMKSGLVKVSHHGSENGYCTGLWEQMSPEKSAIAVIAPYSKQGLPSERGLSHITKNAHSTFSASLGAVKIARDWNENAVETYFEGASAEVLVTLRALFPKARSGSSRLNGVCSFFVTSDGQITHLISGEAGKLC